MIAQAIQAAAVFTWLGMVLAISFIEAPLKFRAPGITIELGVGIGRLVFRALNIVEGVLALVVLAMLIAAWPSPGAAQLGVGIALALVLIAGALLVRPAMDRKVRRGKTASGVPRTLMHLAYIALEVAKVALLVALGVMTLSGMSR